ncbi:hypothetical protein V8E51_016947 [Hyaloscypha variabilis]
MSEHLYPTQSGRPQSQAQDLTPYSAVCPEDSYSNHWNRLQRALSDSNIQVSSFNLPAIYDSTLITPVSLTSSPSMPTKAAPVMLKGEIKLSPSTMSPGYHLGWPEDDFASPRYNPPMKLKDPSGILQISTADSSFPASPYVCTSPYYGAFGVSATPHSARTTNSSPGLHASPHLHSAGGYSNDSHHSRQPTPASYRGNFQAPILIAPSPQTLRPATNCERGQYRQNSLQSNQSMQSPPHSQGPPQGPFTQSSSPMHPRGKKRKEPPSDYEAILQSSEINPEEKLLIELSSGPNKLPWKEVAIKFNKITQQSKRVAALQMRKKRLLERLRVWTDEESKSLTQAHEDYEKNKWSSISKGMLKHGTEEPWSKEALQKKWNEMHPEQTSFSPEYEIDRHRLSSDLSVGDISTGNSCWSDEGASSTHSLHECDSGTLMSALSSVTMDEVRNRALSNANARIHLQQQQHHQQMMYDQQQQQHHQQQQNQQNRQQSQHQHGWDSGP